MAKSNNEDKKEIAKLVLSGFGSAFGSIIVSNKYGAKVNEKYGSAIIGGAGLAGAVAVSDRVSKSEPSVALGLIAGTGINALYQTIKLEPIRKRLPDSMQQYLNGWDDNRPVEVLHLNGVPDQILFGDPRVKEIARQMADAEVNETIAALNGAAETFSQAALPDVQYEIHGEEYEGQMNGIDY